MAVDKKNKLIEIQKKIHELRLLIVQLDNLKEQRDSDFIKILKNLGKLSKTDLVKQLKEDKASFYEKGMHWTPEHSMKWLILWFDKIAETIK
jgi:hypothetical protein